MDYTLCTAQVHAQLFNTHTSLRVVVRLQRMTLRTGITEELYNIVYLNGPVLEPVANPDIAEFA